MANDDSSSRCFPFDFQKLLQCLGLQKKIPGSEENPSAIEPTAAEITLRAAPSRPPIKTKPGQSH